MDYDPEADYALGENGEQKPDVAANGIVESGDPAAYGSGGNGVANAERITTPYMTKYERARILGTRALQISCVHSGSCRLSICCSSLTRPSFPLSSG